jgi:hypothetical protein
MYGLGDGVLRALAKECRDEGAEQPMAGNPAPRPRRGPVDKSLCDGPPRAVETPGGAPRRRQGPMLDFFAEKISGAYAYGSTGRYPPPGGGADDLTRQGGLVSAGHQAVGSGPDRLPRPAALTVGATPPAAWLPAWWARAGGGARARARALRLVAGVGQRGTGGRGVELE